MSPLCSAVRACAYSCRHRETIQAAVTNRKTATPGFSANPVQVAQPVTAVTARIPTNTGLIRRSLGRVVVAVMGAGSLLGSVEREARRYRAYGENVSRAAVGSGEGEDMGLWHAFYDPVTP